MKIHPLFAVLALSGLVASAEDKPSPVGYDDTPLIPGTEWHVHDIKRPAPKVVAPGKISGDAPADAIVLFDGKSNEQFRGKNDAPCPWTVENGESPFRSEMKQGCPN